MGFLFSDIVASTLTRDGTSNPFKFTGAPKPTGSNDELEYFKLSLMEPELSRDHRSDPELVEYIRKKAFAPSEVAN